MPHNRERISGRFPSHDTRNIPAFEITHGDYLKLVRKAFRDHVGNAAKPAQVLADQIECSDKTTQSWLDGKTAPSGILDLRAMARVPAYAALKREIAAMEEDGIDPRLQAKYQELHALTLALARGGK